MSTGKTFLDLFKDDLENAAINDVHLESSNGELIPCSRLALCMRSTVFSNLMECNDASSSETIFPSPFNSWVLREIRHICYFGTPSFNSNSNIVVNEESTRKKCKLLIAMDYYQLDETLAEPICRSIVLNNTFSYACVVIDELGLYHATETRKWIKQVTQAATDVLVASPANTLLQRGKTDESAPVCAVKDASKILHILDTIKTRSKQTIWFQFEVLYTWAQADDGSNQEAAAELFEETGMLSRLQADDPQYFANHDVVSFASNELFHHAQEKRRAKASPPAQTATSRPEAVRMNPPAASRPETETCDDAYKCCFCTFIFCVSFFTMVYLISSFI